MSTKPFFAARIEDYFNKRLESILRRRGWHEMVIGYTGYGTVDSVRVLGRVVLSPSPWHSHLGRVTEEFLNRRGWRNFLTAPCVQGQVTVTLGSRTMAVRCDRDGYVDVRIREHGLEPGWHLATITTPESPPCQAAVQIVGDDVTFGIISDIDDTIITTWLPRPLIAAWNTFVRTEAARLAVPGMASMYQSLLDEHPGAPVIYVSTGAWNTHAFLTRFLKRHGYPNGPILLTDWGPTNTGFFRSGQMHKRESLLQLAREFPNISWVLIGDDGQHDLMLYAEFAQFGPEHVRAIVIRQLTQAEQILAHGTTTALDDAFSATTSTNIPLILAADGRALLAKLRDLPALLE